MDEILYFGCDVSHAGHYLYTASSTGRLLKAYCHMSGWEAGALDGVYPPARRDKRNHIEKEAVQGAASLTHVTRIRVGGLDDDLLECEWTVLAFWDRSADKRGGSNSAFLLKGTHDFNAIVKASKTAFPRIWKRLDFHVHRFIGEV